MTEILDLQNINEKNYVLTEVCYIFEFRKERTLILRNIKTHTHDNFLLVGKFVKKFDNEGVK